MVFSKKVSNDSEQSTPQNKYGEESLSGSARNTESQPHNPGLIETGSVARLGQTNGLTLFKIGMCEKEVKIQLFILEGEIGFDALTNRQKTACVAKFSGKEIKEWYYKIGIAGDLPSDWESFKTMFITFCSGKGIHNMTKFKEEKWSSYVSRLKETAENKGIPEEKVLKKLRLEKAPTVCQTLFFGIGNSLKEIIKRLEDWEKVESKEKKGDSSQKRQVDAVKKVEGSRSNQRPVCFHCGVEGHIKKNCFKLKTKGNFMVGRTRVVDTDEKEIKLNDSFYSSIFDSGSSINIVSSEVIRDLGIKRVYTLNRPLEVYLINKEKIMIKEYVKLETSYKNFRGKELFYVLKEPLVNVIIGNQLIKKMIIAGDEKFPVKCPINTPDNVIVSWSRTIKNLEKQEGFQRLVG